MEKHVLVAEDDAELRRAIAEDLQRAGLVVSAFADGREVVRLVEAVAANDASAPCVIVADIRMPWGGFALLETTRRLRVYVPVILITAFGAPAVHARASRMGAAALLDKPFALTELRELVMNRCR
jgi:CheY-like chemotaxis protein